MTLTGLDRLARRALAGEPLGRPDALRLLASDDADLLDLLAAAGRVRRHFFGNRVTLAYLVNLRSGLCPEDCTYCSQRLGSTADVLTYSWLTPAQALAAAGPGIAAGARRVCLVASGRGPSTRDVERVGDVTRALKGDHPGLEVCACLGLLRDGQAGTLRDAGVDAYNHNLNTSQERYSDICTTHTYADRVATVRAARSAGLSPCSGLIVGLGEDDGEIVDVLTELRGLGAESVPVNFLLPFDGTPLAGRWELTPQRCLRILAVARLACPDAEIRVAAGREVHLRSLQPLALHVASAVFLGDYLTSEGRPGADDLAMIADAGFVVAGLDGPDEPDERVLDRPARADRAAASGPGAAATVRRRGAGTSIAPNA